MVEPSSADELKKIEIENKRLKAAVAELSILNDIATAISSTMELEKIIELIVKKCIKHLRVEQGSVTLLEEQTQETPFRTMVRKADTSRDVIPYRLDTQLTGWMLKNQKPLLVNDFQSNSDFKTIPEEGYPAITSLLSVPLLLKGRMIGSLNVFNKKSDEGFTEDDKRLLTIIATQSAQVVEAARLYEEERALRLVQEEMNIAYKIQMDLLPGSPPRIAGYDISGVSIPAKSIGGDYFDFINISDHRLGLCLGDVSGKGIPAALLMANLQATLRGQRLETISPKECMSRSNALIFNSTDRDKFATLFYGVLDTRKHILNYCNAGHNYPFIYRPGKEHLRLDTGGLVLGALEEFSYIEDTVEFGPGSILLIFSDGISEAINAKGEEFGEERLPGILMENLNNTAKQLIDKIIGAVQLHAGGMPQMDDMTIVVVKHEE